VRRPRLEARAPAIISSILRVHAENPRLFSFQFIESFPRRKWMKGSEKSRLYRNGIEPNKGYAGSRGRLGLTPSIKHHDGDNDLPNVTDVKRAHLFFSHF
jgi:hypothetical protein